MHQQDSETKPESEIYTGLHYIHISRKIPM